MNEQGGSVEDDEPEGWVEDDEPEESAQDDEKEEPLGHERNPSSQDTPGVQAGWEQTALKDFPPDERGLILRRVNHFWKEWGGGFTASSREDMLGEAVIGAHAVRERAVDLPKAAVTALIAIAIDRRLRKRAADDFRHRLRTRTADWVELDPERLQALEAESDADWDNLAGDSLIEIVHDPRVAASLGALSALERLILDLKYIEGLTHQGIVLRLNEAPEKLPQQRKLTAGAVARRHERAIDRLKELLAVAPEQ